MFQDTSLRPIFLRIADWVEDQIVCGTLSEGDQVPSTNQFATQFQINPATAGKGINLLVDDGILYKKRGIGMFVAEGAVEKVVTKRKEQFVEEYLLVVLEEAKKLGITKKDLIQMIEKEN